ncbi:hypothetical protein JQF47_000672 [Escherichia coli]|nr:hypothetical protein [Escherichia coli]HAJ1936333.1 hypothetical protein [Escherichia coli]HAJ1942317.1 hypothetical protein [Escherichia coli]HAJ1947335.1 hypothetical protein [Escherichia coli]HAX8928690.1 hypothetical protein [Escherichia coli]
MFIAWYWIVLIVLLAGGYFLHLKRYCKAFRHDRDALLAARSKLDKRSIKKCLKSINNTFNNDTDVAFSNGQHLSLSSLTNSRRL